MLKMLKNSEGNEEHYGEILNCLRGSLNHHEQTIEMWTLRMLLVWAQKIDEEHIIVNWMKRGPCNIVVEFSKIGSYSDVKSRTHK